MECTVPPALWPSVAVANRRVIGFFVGVAIGE